MTTGGLGTTKPTRVSREAMVEARGLVISLINWELSAADGDRMERACDRFGADVMREALLRIADQLERAGGTR